jgi:biotin carboxyl carrier protein
MKKKYTDLKELSINCTVYKTRLSKKFQEKIPYSPPDRSKVFSFIPGTIIELIAKPGDKLSEGDDLLVLEAMKMKNRIKSPVSGVVKSVNVDLGATVPRGTLLIEFEK